jgi:hypothetical protein
MTLLDQIGARQALHLPVKLRRADDFAQHLTRVVEAQGLVEVRRDEEMLGSDGIHDAPARPRPPAWDTNLI